MKMLPRFGQVAYLGLQLRFAASVRCRAPESSKSFSHLGRADAAGGFTVLAPDDLLALTNGTLVRWRGLARADVGVYATKGCELRFAERRGGAGDGSARILL